MSLTQHAENKLSSSSLPNNSGQGYFTQPTVFQNQIIFVCENDLWHVPLTGGRARRLTSLRSEIHSPVFSPDGRWVACCTMEEGEHDVYLMEAAGSPLQRLTWLNSVTHIIGWSPDAQFIFFRSTHQAIHHRGSDAWLYRVSLNGGPVERLPYGPAMTMSRQIKQNSDENSGIVLGRNNLSNSRWKRYRGGMSGEIWVDTENSGNFERILAQLPGNTVLPFWVGEASLTRIWLLSDHEGIGNLYSCTPQGKDLRQETFQKEYYVRFPATDGQTVVYHVGGELWKIDLSAAAYPQRENAIPIRWHSTKTRLQRRFFYGDIYWEETSLHPQGHEVALTARGKLFSMPLWEQAVRQHGVRDGVRYRLPCWLAGGKLAAISDQEARNKGQGAREQLDVFGIEPTETPERSHQLPPGRVQEIAVSPAYPYVAMATSRLELYIMNAESGRIRKLDSSKIDEICDLVFSPDGRWLAYTKHLSLELTAIFLLDLKPSAKGKRLQPSEPYQATQPVRYDFCPAFDPEGRWLYFLSSRTYNPIWDTVQTGTSFSRSMKPYLLTLKKDSPNPFIPRPYAPGQESSESANQEDEAGKQESKDEKNQKIKDEKPFSVEIDLEGITERILEFPAPEGIYEQIYGLPDKAIFTEFPLPGALDVLLSEDDFGKDDGILWMYDFQKQETENLAGNVGFMQISSAGGVKSASGNSARTLLYNSGNQLRAVEAGVPVPEDGENAKYSRKNGWLDLTRVRISVRYPDEWAQMFREAWRLQKEFFWTEDLSGVDWEKVYRRYVRLLPRIGSRSELSDLIWETQGELGTSHAYEYGGDYPHSPRYPVGCLGADLEFEPRQKIWIFRKIYRGDIWKAKEHSPLAEPGVSVEEGDCLSAVGGVPVDEQTTPGELLVHQAGQSVSLTVRKESKGRTPEAESRQVIVQTLAGERAVRYREWVRENEKIVSALTKGRVGYLHLPDMSDHGIAEFHRGYLAQVDREGLIIDTRYNAGGMVSPLILEKLAHRHLGYDVPRWGAPESYPYHTLRGHLMVIANQFTGSDGDMFGASFRQLKLGLLVGKRTWGGVIGIDGRYQLVDGTTTTQPQYSIWFHHAGWSVENYGVEPDIEVEDPPQSYLSNEDPQLTRTVQEMSRLLKEQPVPPIHYASPPQRSLPE